MASEALTPDEVTEVRSRVNRLAVPVVLENLLVTGVLFVDSLMVGRLGPVPLAAIAVAGPIGWTLFALFRSLSRGCLALVARFIGAGNPTRAAQVASTSFVVSALAGLVASLVLVPLAPAIMRLFGVAPDVVAAGSGYLRILALGLVITTPGHFLRVAFQAAGDTRTPMIAGVLTNLINIGANYVLIYGAPGIPAMGVRGAALGTVLAQSTATVILVVSLWLDPRRLPVFRAEGLDVPLSTRWDDLVRMIRISTPALLETLCFHSAYLTFGRIVAELGTDALAIHRVALALESLAFMPAEGFTVAASTVAGHYLGARAPGKARFGLTDTVKKSCLWMLPLVVGFLFLPRMLGGLFTDDPAILVPLTTVLRVAAIEMPFLGMSCVMVGGLHGAGDTKSPFRVTLMSSWVIRVPLSWYFGVTLGGGVAGIWVATTLEWAVRTLALGVIVRRGLWLDLDVTTG